MRSVLARPVRAGAKGVTAALVGALAVTACGSGAASNGVSAGGGGDSAAGVTATAVKVGLLSSFSGEQAAGFSSVAVGFSARIAMQNAAGGVEGRKLQFVKGDDQGSPSGALAAAQALVQQDHVFAVGTVSLFTYAVEPYLREQGIPVTGASFDGPEWAPPNDNMFPNSGSPSPKYPAAYGYGQFLKSESVTRFGEVGINIPAGVAVEKNWAASARAAGIKVPYVNDSLPITQVGNFQSIIQQMKADRVNGVFVSLEPEAAFAFLTEAKQAGLQAKAYVTAAQPPSAVLASQQASTDADGLWATTPYVPVDRGVAATKTFQAALAKYAHQTTGPDRNEYEGWIAADLLITGLQRAGKNPDRDSFVKSLRADASYTAGGLEVSPVHFTKSFGTGVQDMGPAPQACSYFIQYVKAHWVSASKPYCGGIIPNSDAG